MTARLRPEDIDVVHPGLNADIHLVPYNQRRVPRLKGTVMHVSADRFVDKRTDQPYYATKIRVEDPRIVENNIKTYWECRRKCSSPPDAAPSHSTR